MENNQEAQIFIQLVLQNQQMAKIALGKMNNPITGKTEINLEFAKLSVDTLDMLKEKTKGNLSEYEEKFLEETLNQLKINYVETAEKLKLNNEQSIKSEGSEK